MVLGCMTHKQWLLDPMDCGTQLMKKYPFHWNLWDLFFRSKRWRTLKHCCKMRRHSQTEPCSAIRMAWLTLRFSITRCVTSLFSVNFPALRQNSDIAETCRFTVSSLTKPRTEATELCRSDWNLSLWSQTFCWTAGWLDFMCVVICRKQRRRYWARHWLDLPHLVWWKRRTNTSADRSNWKT